MRYGDYIQVEMQELYGKVRFNGHVRNSRGYGGPVELSNFKDSIHVQEVSMIISTKEYESLKNVVKIQCSYGNWNYDEYMHGMANGLILALAIIEDKEPKYLKAPKKWLRNKKLKLKSNTRLGGKYERD